MEESELLDVVGCRDRYEFLEVRADATTDQLLEAAERQHELARLRVGGKWTARKRLASLYWLEAGRKAGEAKPAGRKRVEPEGAEAKPAGGKGAERKGGGAEAGDWRGRVGDRGGNSDSTSVG